MAETVEKLEHEAVERLAEILAMPLPVTEHEIGSDGLFDPWDLFPQIYGSYDSEFDKCAIEVLSEIHKRKKVRSDLGAEMFREMLCTADFCDYGTSPRSCFSTSPFAEMLPTLIEKWKAYSLINWGMDVLDDDQGD